MIIVLPWKAVSDLKARGHSPRSDTTKLPLEQGLANFLKCWGFHSQQTSASLFSNTDFSIILHKVWLYPIGGVSHKPILYLFLQLFFPLLPGVQSIWEPAVEEVDEALDNLKNGMDEGMDAFRSQADEVKEEFEASRRVAYKRWRNLVKELRRRASDSKDWNAFFGSQQV